MSKSERSIQWRIDIIPKYLSGERSYAVKAEEQHGMGQTTLRDWVHRYLEHGEACFNIKKGNRAYSRAFRIKCVEDVLSGSETVNNTVAKYNISSRFVLNGWIMKYNANMELEDYEPKREVYMAEARRKTML